MASQPARVAILGAGPSGLAACKAALEEGLSPTVFEKAPGVGGLWRRDGFGKTWTSLHTNLSKFTCVFSDSPWPDAAPDFPSGAEVQAYLEQYASRHDLAQHVRANCRVSSVRHINANLAGRSSWRVAWEDASVGAAAIGCSEEDFDFVVVATGIFATPGIPALPGVDSFDGTVLHAAQYRDGSQLPGKRVLVVGSAFSGADIAADMCKAVPAPASVTISARRPIWYLPRFINGVPADLAFYSRASSDRNAGVTEEKLNKGRHAFFASLLGELPPTINIPNPDVDLPYVAITDHFLDGVKSGKVMVRAADVVRLDGPCVEFSDGHRQEFDAIVWATGYRLDLPFMDGAALETLEFDPEDLVQPAILHECVWRPELPGMAFVGIYRGPYFAAMELQARWACGVFSGRLSTPSATEMAAGLEEERRIRAVRPRPQFPHGDYVGMVEALARRVGVHPEDLLSDEGSPLRKLLYDGPLLPFHYRLVGFGSDREAAERAILSCAERFPLPG